MVDQAQGFSGGAASVLLNFKNVTLGYDGNAVVHNLNFSAEKGDYLWVVGENGSGKSTLILGLLRLLFPMEGRITFCDELAKGKIGYLSQQSVNKKDFPAGVREVVLSGNLNSMGLRPFYSRAEKAKADEAMERLGVKDLGKKCFRELSGGQMRRVLLARAFCAARHLLVLDEPAAGLDPLITGELYELLRMLNKETGIGIIMVSHDTQGVKEYAGRILHMEKGRGYFYDAASYINSDRGMNFLSRGKNNVH